VGKKKRWVEYEAVEYDSGRISTGFQAGPRTDGKRRYKEDDIL